VGTEVKREFTPEQLKELESRGLTMKGGGFPIENVGDLENAIHAYGRARNPEATRAWIIKRAHDLDRDDLIPEDWETGPDNDADDDEAKSVFTADPLTSEHKVVPVSGFKVLDEDEGIVEAIVSVTGIEDRVKDTIEPGAYTKTLAERTPRGCWGHDWLVPISKTLAIKELLPGDKDLPTTLRDGKAWPAGAGALMVQTQFNLGTQRGREAYSDVKFFGQDQEWSIGYNVPPGGATIDPKTGKRSIKSLVLHEYSPVLHGAMPEAVTQSVKDAQNAYAEMIERIERASDESKMLPSDGGGGNHPSQVGAKAPAPKPAPSKHRAAPESGGSSSSASGLHPHQPAGSPKGGQFAPKGSGGGGGSAAPAHGKRKAHHKAHHKAVAAHAAAGGATHTIKKGDTLWAIAAKMLGSGTRWKEIARLNGIKDPRKVPIGMTLKIPSSKPVKGTAGASKPAATKPGSNAIRMRGHVGDAYSMADKIRRDAKVKDDGSAVVEIADLDALLVDLDGAVALDNPMIDPDVLLVDVESDVLYPDIDPADFVPADTEDVDYPDDEPEPDTEVAGDDYPVDDVVHGDEDDMNSE